jgi:hypothetical protein
MAKSKAKQRNVSPQLVVRISEELDQALREAANGLELDLSALVRLMLVEHVAEYVERGVAAAERLRRAREKRAAEKPVPAASTLAEGVRNIEFGTDAGSPSDGGTRGDG